ncbi:MAG: hypothetical protein AAF560_13855 [Acidobacteriota bacterium]
MEAKLLIWFWKLIAWLGLGQALLKRKGIVIIKKGSTGEGAEKPRQTSGPGWRLVSSYTVGDRARSAQPKSDPATNSETENPAKDRDE